MQTSFQARIGREGRVLIPSNIRQTLGFNADEPVHCYIKDGELRMVNRIAAIKRMQEQFAPYLDPKISLVDELSKERRAEALRESD